MCVCARVCVHERTCVFSVPCVSLMLHVGFYRSLHGDQAKLTERCVPSRENTEYVLKIIHLVPFVLLYSTAQTDRQTETLTASR